MKILRLKLHWQILIGLLLGVVYGIFLSDQINYVSWMGDIFLRLLQMVIVPLILSSIISGVANIGSAERLGRIGLKTIGYYLLTSVLAILTGQLLAIAIKPGNDAELGFRNEVEGLQEATQSFGDTLKNIIPTNIFEAFSQNQMLSVIFFAILFGFFITQVQDKAKRQLTDFFNSVFEVMMRLTMFIIRLTPVGIFGIVAKVVSEQEDLPGLMASMGLYMLVVFLGLTIHATITLPLILRFFARVNPRKHFKAVLTPLITAFTTSSSSATLPLTMEAVEHNDGVSNKITSFTLPLGATVNMDGTALYECVAAIFIAQAYGVELGFTQQLIVVATALLASIGAAGIPMAGLVMITVVLTAVGLPLEGVGLILAVDRILDMLRTTVNVWSDTCGAVVIARSEGEALEGIAIADYPDRGGRRKRD
ncbi:MAG TPA: dicarboxylate/amino acid:cation symporter [Bacteroidales bacterium]|nr:dicarboxylate/amino acid:cation symporter [Bacteroidales bacterium]HNS45765.1 dicarboxylate/amino acid:cation symporter [Bacteroidales bacterium]